MEKRRKDARGGTREGKRYESRLECEREEKNKN